MRDRRRPRRPNRVGLHRVVTPDVRAYLDGCVKRRDDDLASVIGDDDLFIDDPAAPEWVRRWRGPFRVFRCSRLDAATSTTDDEYGEKTLSAPRTAATPLGAGADATTVPGSTCASRRRRANRATGRARRGARTRRWRGAIVGSCLTGDQAGAVTNAGRGDERRSDNRRALRRERQRREEDEHPARRRPRDDE